MGKAFCYKLVGVARGRIFELVRRKPGAPTEAQMIAWGLKRGCAFVGRYYPTRKGWCVLDVRNVRAVPRGRHTRYTNYGRGRRVYENEDHMAMHLVALLT